MELQLSLFFFFFFNDTATTEIYTLSLHDALPIWAENKFIVVHLLGAHPHYSLRYRSEEHTSELQSRLHLVCRLLLEKKKTQHHNHNNQELELMNAYQLERYSSLIYRVTIRYFSAS